ncbi:hypothetical protein E2C01_021290 [Portunus trituberculatus]|uniref:Uncharacterized protein n=1 Tax=Portunus trituberculatus TaxID=210409 RepID=A0A5B7E5P3_PORTR|nr:hypothetical protein [Portunus trituberculatus]
MSFTSGSSEQDDRRRRRSSCFETNSVKPSSSIEQGTLGFNGSSSETNEHDALSSSMVVLESLSVAGLVLSSGALLVLNNLFRSSSGVVIVSSVLEALADSHS